MRYLAPVLLLYISLIVVTLPVSAHAPLAPGQNGNLASATLIPDPLKSYVVYGHLHGAGEAAYFRMEMSQGEQLILAVNVNHAGSPVPDLIMMGPGFTSSGSVPSTIEIPPGSGALVIAGTAPEKGGYEAFAPSVIYEVASYSANISRPGTYYVVVYAPVGEFDYSFVVGYKEEFTAKEWLLTAISLIGIYLWEGQPPWVVAAPYAIVLLLGIGLLAWQQRTAGTRRNVRLLIASICGLLYLGSGVGKILQMFWVFSFTGYSPEASITLVFAVLPILLGIWALWLGRPELPATTGWRISLCIIGGLGFVVWAGLLIGPVLALIAAFLPEELIRIPT